MKYIKEIVERMTIFDKYLFVFFVLGFLIVLFTLIKSVFENKEIEIIEENYVGGGEKKVLVVDIGGAVLSPGVYELETGSRYKDALIKAGGFAADADRNFVERQVNLAENVKDGQKIFIPRKSDTTQGNGYPEAKIGAKLVNVNTASAFELDTLWGIGEARADNIVKSRPYKDLEEMVSKGVITKQILEKNRLQMTAY